MDYRKAIDRLLLIAFILGMFPSIDCDPLPNENQEEPSTTPHAPPSPQPEQIMSIGPCKWIIRRTCPDEDIKFYLFTRKNMMDRQRLRIDTTLDKSNISESFFNPQHPTKIIIHGYNSDMFLNSLILMKDEYLQKDEYNLIFVDWSVLSPGPCYFSSVHNTRHAGACVAMLVERILDMGTEDMHVIGFSLGAQLANFIARNLQSFLLPRITGLDPAMPLFVTSAVDEKLDPTDAEFVDVIHTNALVQGKLERCGHVDFYMNGGIFQPGCTGNIFACSHQRAPKYFMESIRTDKGFWGWACSSYISYMLGMCPPTNFLVEAGENANPQTKGLYLITTSDASPFALGKWTDLPGEIRQEMPFSNKLLTRHSPLLKEVDEWGKLEGNFNNIVNFPTPYLQYPYGEVEEIGHHIKDNSPPSLRSTSVMTPKRTVRPSYSKFRRKDNPTAQDSNTIWSSYRTNLTMGFIDKSIFQVPRVTIS